MARLAPLLAQCEYGTEFAFGQSQLPTVVDPLRLCGGCLHTSDPVPHAGKCGDDVVPGTACPASLSEDLPIVSTISRATVGQSGDVFDGIGKCTATVGKKRIREFMAGAMITGASQLR